jgi:alpha-galactosidase
MPRITIIGAGSMVFCRNLLSDILAFDSLKDTTFALMDVDHERLAVAEVMAKSINKVRGADATIEIHHDRRAALDGADYVINTIGVGGFDATKIDFHVPDKFGLRQTIADTLGIGGIFRSLRSIPVVLEICWDIEELCPGALMLNYTNPMATHCLAMQRATDVDVVGLCHGVKYTRGRMIMLAKLAEMGPSAAAEVLSDHEPTESGESGFMAFYNRCIQDETVQTLCAGINHMAAFIIFRRGQEDLYPLLYQAYEDDSLRRIEAVRLELMARLGYFFTESSGHIAEYLPWFMRHDDEIERLLLRPSSYIGSCEHLAQKAQRYKAMAAAGEPFAQADEPVSIEYASRIINAIETDQRFMFNGNVHNCDGALISNLPRDCCVEVPCIADGLGIRPTAVGDLPPQCAAMMRTNINVQDLVVEAVLEENRDHVYHAAMFDPNTSATLTLPKIRELVDAMFEAHGDLMKF